MIRTILAGAGGRMGLEVRTALTEAEDLQLVGLTEAPGHPATGTEVDGLTIRDRLDWAAGEADLVIDFTTAKATLGIAAYAAEQGMGLVSGVTGLTAEQEASLRDAAARIPLLHASNMSQGVTALRALVRQAAGMLRHYDVEITEMHHRRKTDAPSGTALTLARAVKDVRQDLTTVHGREGTPGPRGAGELGIHALRGGDVVGEHHVLFAGTGERIRLTHVADHRGAFVAGVLAACRFVAGREAGFYTMENVLGLSPQCDDFTGII